MAAEIRPWNSNDAVHYAPGRSSPATTSLSSAVLPPQTSTSVTASNSKLLRAHHPILDASPYTNASPSPPPAPTPPTPALTSLSAAARNKMKSRARRDKKRDAARASSDNPLLKSINEKRIDAPHEPRITGYDQASFPALRHPSKSLPIIPDDGPAVGIHGLC
ncbi:hypothetical protein C8R43DRAFT_1124254 [Mycena crocata]|nr:hypothetical protein C8R43DRAFT_1124254 [Mycena crocata]